VGFHQNAKNLPPSPDPKSLRVVCSPSVRREVYMIVWNEGEHVGGRNPPTECECRMIQPMDPGQIRDLHICGPANWFSHIAVYYCTTTFRFVGGFGLSTLIPLLNSRAPMSNALPIGLCVPSKSVAIPVFTPALTDGLPA
jgi:hypothetical protein